MSELLIVGGILFIAYTLAQGRRAQLAMNGTPNVLLQNTGGRQTIIQGEPNSASPFALTQAANPTAIIAPPVPALALPQPAFALNAPTPAGNYLITPGADNGSTSFASSVAMPRVTFQPVPGRYYAQ